MQIKSFSFACIRARFTSWLRENEEGILSVVWLSLMIFVEYWNDHCEKHTESSPCMSYDDPTFAFADRIFSVAAMLVIFGYEYAKPYKTHPAKAQLDRSLHDT